MDNNLPIMVFNMKTGGNVIKAVQGDTSIGTLVTAEGASQTAK
jgi:uridylate kinase